jgi:Abnormal spindle-like microcephaly-assoc'd, ASPM-SPD-2-Hydin
VPSDAAGTLESEVVLKAGTGSQSAGNNCHGGPCDRWGDYSSLTVDPTDDCTFWFSEEYVKVTGLNGGFNWSTAIGNFVFPGCSGSPNFTLTANPNTLTISQGNHGTSTITVVPSNGFSGNVTLSATGMPSGVTAGFSPNPTATTSTLTLTASATAATGTSTITITGTSGSLTATTTLSLTVTASGPVVTLTPTSLVFGKTVVGVKSAAKSVTLSNTGNATLNITSIAVSGDFAQATSTKPCGSTLAAGANCIIKVTFTPTQLGTRTGNITITDNAANTPQTVPLSGTGIAPVTLTPTSATYAAQTVGTTSLPKTFTLKNNQSVTLSSIVISTTGDFSVSTTTCGASLAAKTNCTIKVVFTPTATGTRTGTLKATDNASNNPQVSNLTGTGK